MNHRAHRRRRSAGHEPLTRRVWAEALEERRLLGFPTRIATPYVDATAYPTYDIALGVIQNSADGTATGTALFTTFDGNPVYDTDVLVKFTYYGDTNLNGAVDGTDYSRVDNGYLHSLTGWFNGDFNYDGSVNGSDYTLIDNACNIQGAVISDAVATARIADGSAVPEPGMPGLLSMGMMGLSGRRWRRRKDA